MIRLFYKENEKVGIPRSRRRTGPGRRRAKHLQNTSDFVTSVVEQGVKYLDTRSVFWTQQVPAQTQQMLDALQRQEAAKERQVVEEKTGRKEESLKRKYEALLDDVMRCNQGLCSKCNA